MNNDSKRTALSSSRWITSRRVLATFILLAVLGWWAGNHWAASADAEMRVHLLRQATTIARAINPDLVRKLTFTAADKDSPVYKVIREQMTGIGKTFPNRGIYSMALRDGKIFFGPENYPEGDPMASVPGTVYKQPPAEVFRIFENKHSLTIGSYTDEYGTFVSAMVPVLDPFNKEVLMVVGVDIMADNWKAEINVIRRE
jgi:hypothetical protein